MFMLTLIGHPLSQGHLLLVTLVAEPFHLTFQMLDCAFRFVDRCAAPVLVPPASNLVFFLLDAPHLRIDLDADPEG